MKSTLEKTRAEAREKLLAASSLDELGAVDVRFLGRKGVLREIMTSLKSQPAEERPLLGKLANEIKREIASEIERRRSELADGLPAREAGAPLDISLPGRRPPRGRLHPITQTINAIKDVFARLGFEVVYGPEVELDYYNFEALNIPRDHPSRDAFDTFYVDDDVLLRSQTSTVQIRVMEKREPPVRVIAPGRVYRPDTVDASHSFMFHQVEGLMVDEGVTFADLKYVLNEFCRACFGEAVRTRFRPHFFPFTEPSVEVDVSCIICGGSGCSVCSRKGWLEILGAGMVDPNVFEAVGYDPERYTGFAFGMGVDRIAMLKHGINDIRLFLDNDLRFLQQF